MAREQAQAQLRQAARSLLAQGMTIEQVAGLLGLAIDQVAALAEA
jgi:predicted transposase YdaD